MTGIERPTKRARPGAVVYPAEMSQCPDCDGLVVRYWWSYCPSPVWRMHIVEPSPWFHVERQPDACPT
jgi:hypothetical protein